ncbi:MAG: hypothetical protein F6J90_24485 [Moorea sp. SIOASIH]|uniref:hypothetical protein n=1 Tax=Moorena sp. SIOASIH TaxID=2607817 RepID=UPI0013B617B8|nr:hypothetical protein [Moorena sp. SIOASIH]NEO39322.1 hypothetical protein [Moorena sp. SIOASIH]
MNFAGQLRFPSTKIVLTAESTLGKKKIVVMSAVSSQRSAVSGQQSAVSSQWSVVSLFYSKAPIALRARWANTSVEQASSL